MLTEKDLYDRLLPPDDAGAAQGDVGKIADLGTVQKVRAQVREQKAVLGLPRLAPEDSVKLVAVSRSTDATSDDARVRLLNKWQPLQPLSVAPDTFSHLGRAAAALTSVEAAATPLAEAMLQGVADFDAENRRVNQAIEKVLHLPPDHEIAPGVTVKQAATALAEVLRLRGMDAQSFETRHDDLRRHQARLDAAIESAHSHLQDTQAVSRLRRAAAQGLPGEAAT